MKTSTIRLLTGLALATTFGLAAQAAQAADPIRIGSVVSATGPAGFLGDPQTKTLEMYVDSINKAGGVLGRPLELVSYDDGSDVNKASSFTKRLIHNDQVDVIIGGTMSGAAMAMIPQVEENQIPLITMAGAISIVEPAKKWVFKTSLTDRIIAEMVFQDMQKRGLSKIALISETSGFGQSGKKESEQMASKYDIQIVAQESYGAKDTDMTPQLTKIKHNQDVQAVFVIGAGQGPALLTRNFKQLSIDRPLYQSYAVCSDEFIGIARDAANGVRLPCSALTVANVLPESDPQKTVAVDYVKAYQDRWHAVPSHFGGCAYDALMIYVNAVKQVGSTDKAKVRDAIEQTRGMMLTGGEFNMSPTDHMGLDVNAYRMQEISNGKWVLAD
ncbi:ABC transporter substrate-binding protein [Alcaligenaceae bacterium CGII-47]|nr:ABC transporter substrate-binding protein [Alcaligenaceae bacterium CGII-47]